MRAVLGGVQERPVQPRAGALGLRLAGLLGVPLRGVMVASLFRFPKTGFYLWLLMQGWALGG